MIEELLPELPFPATSAPYWAAAQNGSLLMQRCESCGRYQHPPRPVCLDCLGDSLAFVPMTGVGTVFSFTVVERALLAELRDHVPYVLAIVELVEGPKLVSLIRDCPPDEVAIGMEVRVGFERVTADVTLPVFRPR